MPVQNVLLVAGFNYENAGNANFQQYCNHRMVRLLSHTKNGNDMVFTLFDVGNGKISQSTADSKTKKRSWNELKSFNFNGVTTANYKDYKKGAHNKFNQKPEHVMSIMDIYHFIQTIGAGPEKGTVTELSFFSHGWMGGPILVNTDDPNGNDPSVDRKPYDKDARAWKDFIAPTMDKAALSNFRAAFATTGIIWSWGCAFYVAANIVLNELRKTIKSR